jgi:hypothetical protein
MAIWLPRCNPKEPGDECQQQTGGDDGDPASTKTVQRSG